MNANCTESGLNDNKSGQIFSRHLFQMPMGDTKDSPMPLNPGLRTGELTDLKSVFPSILEITERAVDDGEGFSTLTLRTEYSPGKMKDAKGQATQSRCRIPAKWHK